jgi:hypothetical protein
VACLNPGATQFGSLRSAHHHDFLRRQTAAETVNSSITNTIWQVYNSPLIAEAFNSSHESLFEQQEPPECNLPTADAAPNAFCLRQCLDQQGHESDLSRFYWKTGA